MHLITPSLRRALAALALVGAPLAGQASGGPGWATDTIRSVRLDETRTIFVATPDGYAEGTDSFPVLVLLDADDRPQFQAAIANARFLASRQEIPELIIVGIVNGRDRGHDMTPPGTGQTLENEPTAGGADAFEDFITDEVLPRVRATYRTRPTTLLAGHSYGGLFALHVVATREHPYRGVIAMSPSVWWNDSAVVETYARAIAARPAGPRLFMTSGGYEGAIDRPTQKLVARLDELGAPGIPYAYLRLPDASHGLTPQPSLIAGLRFMFEPVSVARLPISGLGLDADSADIVGAFEAAAEIYGRGARALSLPDGLPEGLVNQYGYAVLNFWELPGAAVALFAMNVANHPESANAHDSYADGLLAVGDTTAAMAEYRRAVALWEAQGHDNAEVSRQKLAALEEIRKR